VRWFWQYEMRVWLCFLAHFKLLHVEQRCDDNEGILRKLLLNFKAIAQQPVRELGSEPLRTPIVSNATAFVVSTWWTTPEASASLVRDFVLRQQDENTHADILEQTEDAGA
jgi:hypothetical protein